MSYPAFNLSAAEIWDESLLNSHIYRNLLQVTLAMMAGFMIGFNGFGAKKGTNKMMIYAIVCTVSCFFGILSSAAWLDVRISGAKADQTSAAVVTGVGFLGSGFLIKSGTDLVSGMKKAGVLWLSASIGICFGYQYYIVACYGVFLVQVLNKCGTKSVAVVKNKVEKRKNEDKRKSYINDGPYNGSKSAGTTALLLAS